MQSKKIRVSIVFFGIVVFLYFILKKDNRSQNPQSLESVDDADSNTIFDNPSFSILNGSPEKLRLSSDRNIFFHETSCFNKIGLANLNCRQACSVESAARANPNMSVNLLFFNTLSPTNRTKEFIDLLRKHYKNIKPIYISVEEYIQNSPIENWYKSGVINTSLWPVSHLSDILRFFTLWKFGGIYMDLDVVVIKTLEDLSNFAGAESVDIIASSVLSFTSKSPGPEVAEACLRDLMKSFDGRNWGNNGPLVITRVLRDLCGVYNTTDMTPERCSGFHVFPTSVFNPIYYYQWQLYFEEQQAEETMRKIMQARTIHVWNKLSEKKQLHRGSRAPYALIAKSNCPLIYERCQSEF